MEPRLALPVVVGILLLHGRIGGTFAPANLDRELRALSRILDYVGKRPHQMDPDVTLGISIAEANIASALLHENAGYLGERHSTPLGHLLIECDRTRRYLKDKIVPANGNLELLQSLLSDPQVWTRRISWKKLSPRTPVAAEAIYSRSHLSHDAIVNLTMQGEPKEVQSDYCLLQVIRRSKLRGKCNIPRKCLTMLTQADRSRGYPLTHKLLILQVSEAVGCRRMGGIESSDLIRQYCSAILVDLLDIDAAGYPESTRDLAIEQLLLCGMEGYTEFTSDHYEALLLDWARPSGCYSAFGSPPPPPPPPPPPLRGEVAVVRRTSSPTDFGCDSHTTGLAAALLSLYIRQSLDSPLDQSPTYTTFSMMQRTAKGRHGGLLRNNNNLFSQ